MTAQYTKKVLVRDIANYFSLEQITGDKTSLERWVVVADMNRPGFELSGYFKLTEPRRIVIIGNKEIEYISHMTEEEQRERYPKITDGLTPMIIITRDNDVPPILKEVAEQSNFPIFRTPHETSRFQVDLVSYLDEELAPEDTISGVLLVVYGMGVLLTGESGIGKSEAALELIKRGHRLVSDDVVEIRKINEHTLIGTSPDVTRHFIELRGIGIIDVKTLYGVECVKEKQQIDLVIKLEDWKKDADYDRLGLEEEYIEYLGNKVVCHSLPIRPGRNLAVICETAAVNHRQKKMGYNAAQELYRRVQENLTKGRLEED